MNDLITKFKELPLRGKVIVLASVGFIFLLVVSFGFIENRSPESKKVSEVVSPSTPAVIVNSGSLFQDIGGEARYLLLRKDLTKVARDYYKLKDGIIEFKLTSSVTKKAGTTNSIEFTGQLSGKGNITFKIDLLNYNRLKINASDGNTSLNSYFDSNSTRNQLIATLPISTPQYSIDYNADTDSFIISVYDLTDASKNSAQDKLKSLLGTANLSGEKVNYFYPTADDNGSFQPPQLIE